MKELLNKLMKGKHSDKEPDDVVAAKRKVIEDLRAMAQDMLKEKVGGSLKKVTVASDSKEGLQAGLEKAKELVQTPNPEEVEADVGDKEQDHMAQDSEDSDLVEGSADADTLEADEENAEDRKDVADVPASYPESETDGDDKDMKARLAKFLKRS